MNFSELKIRLKRSILLFMRYRVIISLKLSTAPVEAFSCQASSGIVLYRDIVYGLLKLLSAHRSELIIISTDPWRYRL